jgi:hypothetical protein
VAGLAGVAVLVLVLGLGGCGVSATDQPAREGDAIGGTGNVDTAPIPQPVPRDASNPKDLVTNFFRAAAGGQAAANDRMKAYLTDKARAAWPDPANLDNSLQLTVVRITDPTATLAVGVRTPVTLDYQVVGTMGDLGRIDYLDSPGTHSLTFWVVQDPDTAGLHIDEIDGWPKGQLLLSDAALSIYYDPEPIYFWDSGNTQLVPDLRYVPLTINTDQRAYQKLSWLTNGPSPWLGQVQRLPAATKAESVVSEDGGALQVSLSAEATAGAGPDFLRHLMIQLQWSLTGATSSSRIDLRVGDQPQPFTVDPTDFRSANHSYDAYRAGPSRYDITTPEGVVVDAAGTPVALLGTENTGVISAAISADLSVAAVVRHTSAGRSVLQVVHGGQPGHVDTQVSSTHGLGRPSFVPGTHLVLVPADGRLDVVSTADGSATDAAPTLPAVSAAVVSPDGRRVALITNGAVYVALLVISTDGSTLTVGSLGRYVLGGLLTAGSVAWTSESWLAVAGTSAASGAPALWRVTADGVLTQDVSITTAGVPVDDLVAYPQWNSYGLSSVEGLAVTPQGVYDVRGASQVRLTPVTPAMHAPFYGG